MRDKKTRNGGTWTESKFNTFIRNNLRQASRKWRPLDKVKRKARKTRGHYLCNGCKKVVPLTVKSGPKRIHNVFVDHINPIIDPMTGFTSFDDFIDRLFCEEDNLQVLCRACHTIKTNKERAMAKERRQKEKEENGH